ncbi:MAG: hypothetical protein J0M04_02810 [Verrucomicrobia bacterium]|nr:hypothetical protein [Verrucomicrobiota bacterium]
MRRLVIIADNEPEVKHLWNSWEVASGRIEGDTLTIRMRNKSTLVVQAIDPQMVADIVLSHDPSAEIVKGKLGIRSVVYTEHTEDKADAKAQLLKALKTLLDEIDN